MPKVNTYCGQKKSVVFNLFIFTWSHRITEWPGLEGTSRIMNPQTPCHRQGHQPSHLILDQAAQGPIQPAPPGTGHPQSGQVGNYQHTGLQFKFILQLPWLQIRHCKVSLQDLS